MGQARPGGGFGLLISPTGSSLPDPLRLPPNKSPPKHRNHALQELAVQHVERETVVRLGILPLCALSTERQFLAQVTNPKVFVIALQELVVEVAKRERVGG